MWKLLINFMERHKYCGRWYEYKITSLQVMLILQLTNVKPVHKMIFMMVGSTQAFLDFECFLHYILLCVIFSSHAFSCWWFIGRIHRLLSYVHPENKINKTNRKNPTPKVDNVHLTKLKGNSMRANLCLLPCLLIN